MVESFPDVGLLVNEIICKERQKKKHEQTDFLYPLIFDSKIPSYPLIFDSKISSDQELLYFFSSAARHLNAPTSTQQRNRITIYFTSSCTMYVHACVCVCVCLPRALVWREGALVWREGASGV